MRRGFTDAKRLKKCAKRNHDTGRHSLARWWSDKYQAPTTDPRYQSLTFAELLIEFFEDMYKRRDSLQAELAETTNGAETQRLQNALQAIEKVLRGDDAGEEGLFAKTGDAQIDQWLEDLEAGRDPDLYAGLPEGVLKRPGT